MLFTASDAMESGGIAPGIGRPGTKQTGLTRVSNFSNKLLITNPAAIGRRYRLGSGFFRGDALTIVARRETTKRPSRLDSSRPSSYKVN